MLDFRAAQSPAELAQYCGMPEELLDRVLSDPSRNRFYIRHEIPKRGRRRTAGVRTVWEVPAGPLRDAHKAIARRFDLFARLVEPRYPGEFAYGYVRGRGTRKNAKRHCGAPLLLRADIENFFPSIGAGQLCRAFVRLGLAASCAEALARFCTIDDRLPLGLHASPMLANLLCLDLDDELGALSDRLSCVYTRYADDMAFSGNESVPTRVQLAHIVEAHGFRLSSTKFRFTKRGQAHFVTGLSVSDAADPHVPRRMKRRLRLELYYCKKFGLDEHLGRCGEQSLQAGLNRIDGSVRYVSGIEHSKRQKLRESWQAILQESGVGPSYMPQEGRPFRRIAFIVDEAEFSRAGCAKYLGVACATTEELERIRFTVAAAAREYRADPFAPGRPQKVDSKGLHFADVPETVRDTFAKTLAFQPFRSYVAFSRLTPDTNYSSLYVELLRGLLLRRLKAADRAEVMIYVEENPKVSFSEIARAVDEAFHFLEATKDRRPFQKPTVVIARKLQNPELAVPDFVLGTLAHYLDLHSGRPDADRLRFERLRDKFRVVLDLERCIEFSRRRPVLPWELERGTSP